jgi:hypothetical protein
MVPLHMRLYLIPSSVVLILAGSCKKEEPPKPPEFLVTSSIREIMGSMVMPGADDLWNAVSSSVTAKGVEEKAPKTEQEWNDVRGKAITLMEASNLILIPGRHVAPPGAVNKEPSVNLAPDVIEKMIAEEPAAWTMFAHAMHDSVIPALKAIDAKDPMALSDAGAAIDQACETCHLKFWYPKDAQKR